jgi:hypothetical protein
MASLADLQAERERLKAANAKADFDAALAETCDGKDVLAAGQAVRRLILDALDAAADPRQGNRPPAPHHQARNAARPAAHARRNRKTTGGHRLNADRNPRHRPAHYLRAQQPHALRRASGAECLD